LNIENQLTSKKLPHQETSEVFKTSEVWEWNYMDKKEILAEIDKLLREHYPDDIEKVILYGSRSRGDAQEYSD
jgi:predicted nucleotidyltransferase